MSQLAKKFDVGKVRQFILKTHADTEGGIGVCQAVTQCSFRKIRHFDRFTPGLTSVCVICFAVGWPSNKFGTSALWQDMFLAKLLFDECAIFFSDFLGVWDV